MQIAIKEVTEQWSISRSTIYKHIKNGKISRLDNGLFDVSEVIRVYGEPSKKTQGGIKETVMEDREKSILLQKIALLETQLSQAEKREEWLKDQIEKAQETVKLLEHKEASAKRKQGLLRWIIGN
ncbi:MAG: plasmid replication DNA-binding protein [Pseudomonadales bacterium]|nr:plasmid replication DNA-binding protein [Pseudomonadales bacterium]